MAVIGPAVEINDDLLRLEPVIEIDDGNGIKRTAIDFQERVR